MSRYRRPRGIYSFLGWARKQQVGREVFVDLAKRVAKLGLSVDVIQDSPDHQRLVDGVSKSGWITMEFGRGGTLDPREFAWVLAHEVGHALDSLDNYRNQMVAGDIVAGEEAAWAHADCLLPEWGIDTGDDYRRQRDKSIQGYRERAEELAQSWLTEVERTQQTLRSYGLEPFDPSKSYSLDDL